MNHQQGWKLAAGCMKNEKVRTYNAERERAKNFPGSAATPTICARSSSGTLADAVVYRAPAAASTLYIPLDRRISFGGWLLEQQRGVRWLTIQSDQRRRAGVARRMTCT